MTPQQLLRQIGGALFGPDFRPADLTGALHVNARTMRRWLNGDAEPSEGAWRDLLRLAYDRRANLNMAIGELEKRFKPLP